MEKVPIDKAVMEKAPNVRVLEVVYDWSDVGDWRALAELVEPDARGNTIQGPVVAVETSGSIIVSLVLGLPTVGPLLLQALVAQDMFLAGTIVLLLGIMTVVGTLISDLLLVWIEPRLRLTGRS